MKRVRYRPSAASDLEAIHDFIAADNPAAARRVIAHIRRSVERLAVFPESGRASRVPGAHELVVPRSRFIVLYEIGQDVEIVAVFHGARGHR